MNITIKCIHKCKECFEHFLSPSNKLELARNILDISEDAKPCPFAPVSDSSFHGITLKKEHGTLILQQINTAKQ